MTPELLDQRRWQRLAELVQIATVNVVEPVIMPHAEGGGILIIMNDRSFHFWNFKSSVNVDVSIADTGEMLEGRRNCFRFDAPLEETVQKMAGEVLK